MHCFTRYNLRQLSDGFAVLVDDVASAETTGKIVKKQRAGYHLVELIMENDHRFCYCRFTLQMVNMYGSHVELDWVAISKEKNNKYQQVEVASARDKAFTFHVSRYLPHGKQLRGSIMHGKVMSITVYI